MQARAVDPSKGAKKYQDFFDFAEPIQRIPTGRLNAFLGQLVAAHPHPLRGGKQSRILFATQARTRPPRFVVFASGFLEHGYRRFIERRLREDFDFTGSPIVIGVRIREKRRR